MKKSKKLFSLILAVAMMVGIVSVGTISASADSDSANGYVGVYLQSISADIATNNSPHHIILFYAIKNVNIGNYKCNVGWISASITFAGSSGYVSSDNIFSNNDYNGCHGLWHDVYYNVSSLGPGDYTIKAEATVAAFYNNIEVANTRSTHSNTINCNLSCSHTNQISSTDYPASCTAGGYTAYHCNRCGADWTGNNTGALGHASANNRSCTHAETCSRCGTQLNPAYGHSSAGNRSCTQAETCSRCGTQLNPAYGHSSANNRSCTQAETCSRCGAQLNPAYGHDYSVKNTDRAYLASVATCTAPSKYYYKCSRCAEHGSNTFDYGSSLGHSWDGGVVTTPATPTTEGVMTFTCTRCKTATRTEPIPVLTGLLLSLYNADLTIAEKNQGKLYTGKSGFDADWNAFETSYNTGLSLKTSNDETARETASADLMEKLLVLDRYKVLDTTPLQNALSLTPQYEEQYYSEASYQSYTSAKSAAEAFLSKSQTGEKALSDKDEMEDTAELLRNAFNSLELKKADFTNINNALQIEAVSHLDWYVDEVADPVRELIAQIDYTKTILDQEEVDNLASQIVSASQYLTEANYKLADYTKVDEAINAANALTPSNYEDFSGVTDAIDAVVRTKLTFEQEEVDEMAKEINRAIKALVPVKADFTELNKAKAAGEAIENKDFYLNYYIVENLIAQIDYNKDIFHQNEVDELTEKIYQAIEGLNIKDADYTPVTDAIDLKDTLGNLDDYTDETLENLDEAIASVEPNLKINEQEKVNKMAEDIVTAIENMVLKTANYSEVNNAIAISQNLDRTNYKDVTPLDEFIAGIDWTIDIRHQADVDAIAQSIYEAMENLELKGADYTNVDIAIENANKKIETSEYDFTDETLNALQKAIDNVDRTLDILSQETVDSYVTAIEEATNALKYVSANYTEVYAALDRANALIRSDYEDLSNVDEAVRAVEENLTIDRQNEVDQMAQAINSAIDSLQYAMADYTAVNAALQLYNSINRGYYNSADLEKVDALVNGINDGLRKDRQDEVDQMAIDLEEAIRSLDDKMLDANTEAMTQAIDDALARIDEMQANYEIVPELLDILYNLIEEASAYEGAKIDVQESIDEITQNIIEATENLEYVFTITDGTTAIIEDNFIFGFYEGITAEEIKEMITFVGNATVEVTETQRGIGTGSKVIFKDKNGETVEEYTVVIFGDADGDGWIDMFDVSYAAEVANYGVEENKTITKALDLNGDTVVDAFDISIIISVANMENEIQQDGNF